MSVAVHFKSLDIDPPGHSRIGGHYFHMWCPYVSMSVRLSVRKTKTHYNANVKYAIQRAHKRENENLLAVAWWVILNSPDLSLDIIVG